MPRLKKDELERLKLDLVQSCSSVAELARKYGVSEQAIRKTRTKLLKVAGPLVTIKKAETCGKVAEVAAETQAGYDSLLCELQNLLAHLGDLDLDSIRTRIVALKTMAEILEKKDRAKAMGINLMATSERAGDEEELWRVILEVLKDEPEVLKKLVLRMKGQMPMPGEVETLATEDEIRKRETESSNRTEEGP